MTNKYSKAPVSEVSCGLFLKTNALIRNATLFEIITELSKEYPVLQTALPSQIEELHNDNIGLTQDVGATGYSTYLLSTSDFLHRIEINQISINLFWQRRDDAPSLSIYPGFEAIYRRLKEIIKIVVEIAAKHGIDLLKEIRLYSLKYADRLNLNPYKEQGLSIPDIISFNHAPILVDGVRYISDNYITKYSIKLPFLQGYSITNVNTPTYPTPHGQMFLLDNRIKGYGDDMDKWFATARLTQLSFFENFFTERILNDWK